MSNHPSAVLLQALEDGEVGAKRRVALQAHVDACAVCRDTVAELRALSRNFSGALARLDRAGEPALAALGRQSPTPARHEITGRAPDRPWLRAAVIAALLVGASSFAGLSALWLRDRLAPREEAATTAVATPEATPGYQSGFTVTPSVGALRIELTGLAADSRVELRLVDDSELSIDVTAADAPVRFSDQRAGRIDVAVNGRADVIVAVPRSLGTTTLVVDGIVRAARSGGEFEVMPAQDGVTVVTTEG